MPLGSQRRVTRKDVKRVQTLIELCMTQNMNKEEAVELISQIEIEPDFIKLVWQKLEEENQEFFKFYYANLSLSQQTLIQNMFSEEQGQITGLTSSAPLPTFDGSHNPEVSSQANSNIGLTTIPSPFPTFDGLLNPEVLSQPNSIFDGSYSPSVLSQPNSIFDGSYSPSVLSQPNSIAGLTASASLSTFDELHNPVDLSQPNSNVDLTKIASFPSFDESHNLAVLPQSNPNVDFTEIAPFPTFDRSHNSMVLSQPNSNMADLPPLPYCIDEQIQESLMPTNMEDPIYSSSCDMFNNNGSSLQTSMHGGVVDVSPYGNDNWINGPSSMLSNQSEDMGLIQRNNGEMIESCSEYSGLTP